METFLSSQINALLLKASWSEDLQRQSGLAMASQQWTEKPGWFLWPPDADGAYGLSLDRVREADGGLAAQGLFSIRFYPRADSRWFAQFSPEERELIQGDFFDETNTPVFEAQGKIPGHLFLIGWMDLTMNLEQSWGRCSLSALENCLEYRRRELVREVPGWELSHRLYASLLCLLAHHGRMKPLKAHGLQEDGFEIVQEKNGYRDERVGPAFFYTMSVLLAQTPLTPPPEIPEAMDGEYEESGATPLFKSDFSCGHLHGPGPVIYGVEALNPKWWSLAGEEFTSHLASSCGCDHEH